MARNISVKVPVATLVASIEAKIAEIDEAVANYPALYEKYEADIQAYKTKVAEFVSGYLSKNVGRIGYDYSDPIRISTSYNGRIELTFDKDIIEGFPERPVEPKKPNQHSHYGREYTSQRDLLERNLKILKMTSQEEVNASTYGAILELL
jgi:hypothetical protein